MRMTRIIFFGTPEFASGTLLALQAAPNMDVVAVVTAPDKPAGRGQQIRPSHVSMTSDALGLTVLKPTRLKDEQFLEALRALKADLFVVVAFRMLPRAVWEMPRLGTFNVHASLLPNYRGAAPIQWAIANGDSVTGVTTFLLNDQIDEGAILLQESCSIGENETISSLYKRLMELGAILAVRTVEALSEEKCSPKPQKVNEKWRLAPKIHADFSELETLANISEIHHRIRACDQFPGASLGLRDFPNERIKLFGSKIINNCNSDSYVNSIELIISEDSIHLSQGECLLEIHEIQWPGKRKMVTSDFLRGFRSRGKFTLRD